MAEHNQRGHEGEEIAARHLTERGYSILHRNKKYGKLELDIIARKDNTLIFVEVKSRADESFGSPLDAITDRKIRSIVSAADIYIKNCGWEGDVRFDLVAVIRPIDGETVVEHIEDAFYPPIVSRGW